MGRMLGLLALSTLLSCTGAGEISSPDGGGGGGPTRVVDPCESLLSRVCGSTIASDAACNGMAACTAAQLTATYERNSCGSRNMDVDHYPTCPFNDGGMLLGTPPPQACEDLRTKSCGVPDGTGTAPCAGDDGCLAARQIADTADNSLCVQALGDNTSYPRCL